MKTYAVSETVKGGIAYTKATEGDFESLKVNGVEVGKFDFIRPHYNSSWLTECEIEQAIETIFERNNYLYSLNPEKIECDYFNYIKTGKPEFYGEYMVQYSWAEETCGLLWKKRT